MATNSRFWQWLTLGVGLLLLALAYLSHSLIQGAFALVVLIASLVELLSPTPQQKVQSQIEKLQQQGIYPQGQPTDEDVRRVLQAGHKLLAIRLYREVHNVPLKQAVEAVQRIS